MKSCESRIYCEEKLQLLHKYFRRLRFIYVIIMAEWYRASASGAVDLGLIPSRVKPMTLKSVFTASLLDAQH